MTQQQARSTDFGPIWPEVAGFGAACPNKQFYRFARKGKSIKYATVATVALLAGLRLLIDTGTYRTARFIFSTQYNIHTFELTVVILWYIM